MRAIRYHGARDLRLEHDVEEPQCKPTEIKIKPAFVGICGSDLHEYYAPSSVPLRSPHALSGETVPVGFGHEFSGTVVQIGPEARHNGLQIGDKVAVLPIYSCKSCHACQDGLDNCCGKLGFHGISGRGGGLSDFICVDDQNVFKLPENVPLDIGALVEPLAVAWHAVNRCAIEPGDEVLVLGAGPIGLGVIQCLKIRGAKIIVSEVGEQRRISAKAFGAAFTFNPLTDNVVAKAKEICSGIGPKVAFDCAGVSSSIQTAALSVRARGTIVNVAVFEKEVPFNPNLFVMGEKSYSAVLAYSPADFQGVIDALGAQTLKPQKMITSKIKMDRIVEDGIMLLKEGRGPHIKILVDLSRSDEHAL